jgi:SAM-dependent methyltransferase
MANLLGRLRSSWLKLQVILAGRSPSRYGFRIARPETYQTPVPEMRVRPHPGYVGTPQSLEHHKRHWLSEGYLADLREAFDSLFGRGFGGEVLEVGCGMGHLHQVLGLKPGQYTGVDMNELFLTAGREHFPGLRLFQGTADRLPFPDGQFDCVVCSDVLIHLEDMRPALREIIRVSRGHVLLRMRSGNGGFQRNKIVYDPVQARLFGRIPLDGRYYYGFYNVLAPEDLAELLRSVGVTEYQCIDLLEPDAPTHGLTKVYFDVAQVRRAAA